MNILHIDEQSGWRGGEQQASYLIEGLVRRGHRCVIAGRPGSPFLRHSHGGTEIERLALPFRGEWDLHTAWRLAAAVKALDIDILHGHTSHGHTMACLAKYFAGRGRVVVSRRVDFVPKSTLLNRWKYGLPDRTIAISEAIGRILLDYGLPEERIVRVYSGIDLRRFEEVPLDRAVLGLPRDVPLIGNVAALVGHKDHDTLLRAFARVRSEIPDVHLAIAGDGPLRDSVEALITELGLGDGVTLLGYRNDIPLVLPLFDIFVLSSREEGLGTSVLDAMACNLPVIATDAGGIPEMVRHGETGLLCPRGDDQALAQAIVQGLQNRPAGLEMAAAARRRVTEVFSVDAMVEGNLAVYESLMAG